MKNIKVARMITGYLKKTEEIKTGDKILIGNTKHKIIIAIKILK